MSNWSERLREWWRGLFQERASTFNFITMQFEKLDVDKLAKRLKLVERAVENATCEIPATTDKVHDGPQLRVIQFIQGHCAEAIAEGQSRLSGLSSDVAATDISRMPQSIHMLLGDFRKRAEGLYEKAQNELININQRIRRAEKDVKRTQNHFGVDRPAKRYQHAWIKLGVATGMLLMQMVLNSYFFALGHEMGFLGGVMFALILASTDVCIATLLGTIGRYISVRGIWKCFGLIGLLFGIAWISGLNLLAAHLREALSGMPLEQASRVALKNFVMAPWALESADSWFLFFLGLFFSTIAYLSGWHISDPVPGYGKAQKNFNDVLEERYGCVEDFQADLRNTTEEHREAIKKLHKRTDDQIVALRVKVDRKKTLLKNLKRYIDHVERSCNALIMIYRDTNRQHRKTPPPDYFQRRWRFPMPAEFEDDTSGDEMKVIQQQQLHESLGKVFEEAFRQLDALAETYRSKVCGQNDHILQPFLIPVRKEPKEIS